MMGGNLRKSPARAGLSYTEQVLHPSTRRRMFQWSPPSTPVAVDNCRRRPHPRCKCSPRREPLLPSYGSGISAPELDQISEQRMIDESPAPVEQKAVQALLLPGARRDGC